MKQILLLLIIVVFSFCALAQVNENFSDGNFTSNPVWFGDDSLFIVNANFQLQSKGTTGTSKDISLSTANNLIDSTQWNCWVRFNLSPSSQNFCRFYLISDQPNLKGNLNGYFIQFGGVTGNTDSITLYKQKGNSFTRIIGGRPATVSKTNNLLRIKVLRNKTGNWQLFSDTLGGNKFALEGIGFDNEFTTSIYSGFYARFTSTNISNYYWDDVYIGPILVDTIPPKIDTIDVLDWKTIRVNFSEEVDAVSALDTLNYLLDNISRPTNIYFENANNLSVIIEFRDSFTNGTNHTISTFGIKDLNNNSLALQNFLFLFYNVQAFDVLISEFMSDPTPSVGLPSEEFIELYNRSHFNINLSNWMITDGTSKPLLPNVDIKPDSFLIICAAMNYSLFSSFGKTIGINNFPSLNDAGDMILLKDKNGNTIHQINYDLNWYNDKNKKNGGWSIEMQNPFDLCKGRKNFAASVDIKGGTPGRKNSTWSILPDTKQPKIVSCKLISADTALILFDDKMDSFSLTTAIISMSNSTTISSRNVCGEFFDSLIISFSKPLIGNVEYTLQIKNAKDCNQNSVDSNLSFKLLYFLPDTAKNDDIVINEIMANPSTNIGLPNAEYIELYNTSSRKISLKNWTIEDENNKAILPDYVLLPDSFILITSTSGIAYYQNYSNAIGVTNCPSLGNDGDILRLKNQSGQIIHAINYTSDWYNDNVKKNGGWSLEMIDPKNPCGGKENWNASINILGGTPGKLNSINGFMRDVTPPKLIKAYPEDNKNIRLTFNEPLDSVSILHSGFASVNPIGRSSTFKLFPDFYSSLTVHFTDSFHTKNVYRILVDSIKDCAGNKIAEDDFADFGLSEKTEVGDFVINEILFNPFTGGVDFVELYNRSDKVIDLQKLFIANTNADNSVNEMYPISADGFTLFPNDYCALTSNTDILKQQYFSPNTKNFIQCNMPSYNDNSGTVLVIDVYGNRYDQFSYDENMHFPLLTDKSGVSLERIDFNRPANDRTNWTSASTKLNATPAYRNSQFVSGNANNEHLNAEPECFSPDDDGYKDVLNIHYSLDESGYTGNLFLLNSSGVMVKQLLKNEILGATGISSWNGFTDKNEKAPTGIYIAYFEAFNLKGDTKNYRCVFVLGGKL